MGRKANRILPLALAVSVLIHSFLLGSAEELWMPSPLELVFPIEASLVTLDPESVAVAEQETPPPVSSPLSPSLPKPDVDVAPVPAPQPVSVPLPDVEPARESPPVPPVQPEPVAPPVPDSAPPVEPLPVEPLPPKRPVIRSFPGDLVIHYSVRVGEGDDGFVAGRATYIWHAGKSRYSLVSTVEATGLAALFISGRIVQVSEGEISSTGLRPSQYWLQRNERKQDVARFNWESNQLMLGVRGGVPLTPQAQDLLSFPFHLAMTATEGETEFALGVTNGRKLNEYLFQVLGQERIALRGRMIDTLHLRGQREGEGALDVWLDLAYSGVPARIRTLDRKGKTMELLLEETERTRVGSNG